MAPDGRAAARRGTGGALNPSDGGRVAYTTSGREADAQSRDDEAELVSAALVARGAACDVVAWDEPGVDWGSYDLVVVRSVWDYVHRRGQLLAWAGQVSECTRLLNPLPVLQVNTDKTYLRGLADRGIPVVPTLWVEGDVDGLDEALERWGGHELVVKPAVSAGARDTFRTRDRAEVRRHAEAILASGRLAMVQPYLPMVEGEGETSLVFLGGRFSHAVRKTSVLARRPVGDPHHVVTPRQPAPDLLAFAEQVLATVPERDSLLYARVDVVRDDEGMPQLMELELTEPYLFLASSEGAVDRFADAVLAVVRPVSRRT